MENTWQDASRRRQCTNNKCGSQDDPREYIANLLVSQNAEWVEKRSFYRSMFWYFHLFATLIFMASFITIFVCATNVPLRTEFFLTLATLAKNPGPGLPLFTHFHIWKTMPIFWYGLIPVILFLYHLFLVLPKFLVDPLADIFCRKRHLEGYELAGVPSHGDVAKMGEPNVLYRMWFDKQLLYGGSWAKHFFYGIAVGMFTSLAAQLVGVTDVWQVLFVFFFTCAGFMNLVFLEHTHRHIVLSGKNHAACEEDNEGGSCDSDGVKREIHHTDDGVLYIVTSQGSPSTSDESAGGSEYETVTSENMHQHESKLTAFKNRIVEFLENRSSPQWPAVVALLSILFPIATVMYYYIVALTEAGGDVRWFVHLAVWCVTFHSLIWLLAIAAFHYRFRFLAMFAIKDYVMLELATTIFNTVIILLVLFSVIFSPRDDEFLYGILTP